MSKLDVLHERVRSLLSARTHVMTFMGLDVSDPWVLREIASRPGQLEGKLEAPVDDPEVTRLSLVSVCSTWQWYVDLEDAQYHCFAQHDRGVREATSVARSIRLQDPESRFIALGYSNGGAATVQFAKSVRAFDIDIRLAVTCDPVPKGLDLLLPPAWVLHKVDNVARWVNVYQEEDRKTLLGFLPIVGHPVDRADDNILIEGLGDHGHVYIPFTTRFLDLLARETGQIVN